MRDPEGNCLVMFLYLYIVVEWGRERVILLNPIKGEWMVLCSRREKSRAYSISHFGLDVGSPMRSIQALSQWAPIYRTQFDDDPVFIEPCVLNRAAEQSFLEILGERHTAGSWSDREEECLDGEVRPSRCRTKEKRWK